MEASFGVLEEVLEAILIDEKKKIWLTIFRIFASVEGGCQKCFLQLFSNYRFGFDIFCRKNIGAKAAHKMLMKLTPVCFIFLVIFLPLSGPFTI